MTEAALTLTEEGIPATGIEESIGELIDLYGGELQSSGDRSRRFTLPVRRGNASSGAIECSLSWEIDEQEDATVTLVCDRTVDAPRAQRVLLLLCGVAGAVMFMLWPFFPHQKEFGSLAWLGGLIALAVYFMTLRRSSGGVVHDFLQRLATRQRDLRAEV